MVSTESKIIFQWFVVTGKHRRTFGSKFQPPQINLFSVVILVKTAKN
jgi:hypothetical protein